MKTARTMLIELYLDWYNNYLTVAKFAEHHGLTENQATDLLELAKRVKDTTQIRPRLGQERAVTTPLWAVSAHVSVLGTSRSTFHCIVTAKPAGARPTARDIRDYGACWPPCCSHP